ncbi:GlcNAc-PI de-N-acetylase [Streptomyces sp. A012304]|nr:GlcNAc-PI de-N-acetylase [Streptomyces sp. A012304]
MSSVALAFTAHPDDAEIGMGGTLAVLAAAGWEVHVVVASVPDHRERRLSEVTAGAAALGAKAHVLDRPGTWQVEDLPAYALVREFDSYVRELRPAKVFTHWHGDTHRDHVLVAQATVSALRGHTADLFMAEQANQYAASVAPFPLNTYVDVSEQFARKLEAVGCHTSQSAGAKYAEHLRARARYHGDRSGCAFAEAFSCVVQRLEFS